MVREHPVDYATLIREVPDGINQGLVSGEEAERVVKGVLHAAAVFCDGAVRWTFEDMQGAFGTAVQDVLEQNFYPLVNRLDQLLPHAHEPVILGVREKGCRLPTYRCQMEDVIVGANKVFLSEPEWLEDIAYDVERMPDFVYLGLQHDTAPQLMARYIRELKDQRLDQTQVQLIFQCLEAIARFLDTRPTYAKDFKFTKARYTTLMGKIHEATPNKRADRWGEDTVIAGLPMHEVHFRGVEDGVSERSDDAPVLYFPIERNQLDEIEILSHDMEHTPLPKSLILEEF